MSLEFLTSLGLSPKEITLYQLLLTLGESPSNLLITRSGFKRATVYKLLYALEKKGLVMIFEKEKLTYFKPLSPQKLIQMTETQQQVLERTRTSLESVLPDLLSSFQLAVEKPVLTSFDGPNGIKKIYQDTLREGKPIYALLQPHEIDPEIREWLRSTYTLRRKKMGIHAYVILSTGDNSQQYVDENELRFRTTRVVPGYKFPFQHEINIYGSKVAIIQYKKGEHPLGIIIQHPLIAQTMKAWFDLAWERAEQYHENITSAHG